MKRAGLFFALAVLAIGCNKASEEPASEPGKTTEPAPKTAEAGGDTPAGSGYAGVQAILTTRCTGCHGEKGKDGIDLRSYDSLMKGGNDGPIVVAGDPAKSLIVKAIKGEGVDRMPKMGSPLSDAEIAQIEAWVKDGAKS